MAKKKQTKIKETDKILDLDNWDELSTGLFIYKTGHKTQFLEDIHYEIHTLRHCLDDDILEAKAIVYEVGYSDDVLLRITTNTQLTIKEHLEEIHKNYVEIMK